MKPIEILASALAAVFACCALAAVVLTSLPVLIAHELHMVGL